MAEERKVKTIATDRMQLRRKTRRGKIVVRRKPSDSNSANRTVVADGIGRIEPNNKKELIKEVRKGVPSKQVQWISDTFGLSKKLILSSLALSNRTIHRRSELLSPAESEKVLQLTLALSHAEEVLGSISKATDWIQSANAALGGETPISLLDTNMGFSEVTTILDGIDYGVYS